MFTSFVPVVAILVWTARDALQNRGRLLTRPHFGRGEICLSNELPTLRYSPLQSVEDEDSGSTELADLSAIASAKEEVLPRRSSASAGPAV